MLNVVIRNFSDNIGGYYMPVMQFANISYIQFTNTRFSTSNEIKDVRNAANDVRFLKLVISIWNKIQPPKLYVSMGADTNHVYLFPLIVTIKVSQCSIFE